MLCECEVTLVQGGVRGTQNISEGYKQLTHGLPTFSVTSGQIFSSTQKNTLEKCCALLFIIWYLLYLDYILLIFIILYPFYYLVFIIKKLGTLYLVIYKFRPRSCHIFNAFPFGGSPLTSKIIWRQTEQNIPDVRHSKIAKDTVLASLGRNGLRKKSQTDRAN